MPKYIRKRNKLIILIIFIIFLLIKNDFTFEEKTKFTFNPVLGKKTTGNLFDPFVMIHNDIYKMYVSWRSKGIIALSTSKDGFNWSDLKLILNKGETNSWESVVNRGSIVIYDNKFYLWYTGQNKGRSEIGLAISDDGYNFTKYENNPILIPEYQYEKNSVMNPHVIYDKEEKIFKMWYAAGEIYEPDVLCYATSINGLNWVKYINNPIFKPNNNKTSLDSFKVGGCDVHKITNQKYIMFYIGYSDIDTARIFIAESNNGINDWKRNPDPIVEPNKGQFDSDACYKPSAIFDKKKNRWMIWYNGRSKNIEVIGLAFYKKYKYFNLLY